MQSFNLSENDTFMFSDCLSVCANCISGTTGPVSILLADMKSWSSTGVQVYLSLTGSDLPGQQQYGSQTTWRITPTKVVRLDERNNISLWHFDLRPPVKVSSFSFFKCHRVLPPFSVQLQPVYRHMTTALHTSYRHITLTLRSALVVPSYNALLFFRVGRWRFNPGKDDH
jgi:hypothetical protein